MRRRQRNNGKSLGFEIIIARQDYAKLYLDIRKFGNVKIIMVLRRSKWNLGPTSNDGGPIGLEMAEFCGSPTSAETIKPSGKSSRSVKKPMFGHQSHGGARAHDQPHVKTEAAAGGGRKASLYMGLVMRTQSPMRLRAWGSLAILAHHGRRNLVWNPLETSKNQKFA